MRPPLPPLKPPSEPWPKEVKVAVIATCLAVGLTALLVVAAPLVMGLLFLHALAKLLGA